MSGLDDINPFADPAVTGRVPSAVSAQNTNPGNQLSSVLDDYNPFDNPASNGQRPIQPMQPPAGAVSTPGGPGAGVTGGIASGKGYGSFTNTGSTASSSSSQVSPPSYSPNGAQFVGDASTDDLRRRQAELEQKASELQRREEELQRQQLLQNQSGRRDNNWPPLPAWVPVAPCFYQDIAVEIPIEFQNIVTMGYRLWMFHIMVLFLNFVGGLTYFIGDSAGVSVFGLSILFLALFTPCSFVCWFRPLYKAFRSDSAINYMVFFFVFFVQSIASCLQTLGLDYFGTVGFINSIRMFSKNIPCGIVMLLVAFCFAFQAVCDVLLLHRVHRFYRTNSTASVQKARDEFTSGVMKNKEVQNIAARGAMSAATGTMGP